MNYEALYQDTLLQIMALKRQLRAERVKNVLARLAHAKLKAAYVKSLEKNLYEELAGHNRGERIDLLLEDLEDLL